MSLHETHPHDLAHLTHVPADPHRAKLTIRVFNELTDELAAADLAVFGVEGHKGTIGSPGTSSADYSLEALPDRPAFEQEAARHVAFARRNKHPLCFALVAFDHGTHDDDGPAAEDEFLSEATARWRDVLRAEDLMGRWAHDEFAILLPNCTTVSAVQLCWRLREETPEGHSFSAGLVSYQGTETVDELVERADGCLAQAKAKGRDRTVAEGLVDLD